MNTSIFISVHKGCGMSNESLEAFRVSKLLNYRALVLSEPSHAEDEAAYAGLVTFAPIERLPSAYTELAALSHTERRAQAERVHADFSARFEPLKLFENAGVYAMLDRLRTAQWGHATS